MPKTYRYIAYVGLILDFHWTIYIFMGRYIPSLYDLIIAHIAGGEGYCLHDLEIISWGKCDKYSTYPTHHLVTAG